MKRKIGSKIEKTETKYENKPEQNEENFPNK